MTEISNNDNIISVSDITARVDELRQERAEYVADMPILEVTWTKENPDEADELANLEKLLEALRGRSTSHDWGGDTYPDSLIADHHFPEYAQDFAEDCGAIQRGVSWIVIDWEATANGLKQDYRSVDFDGAEYWHRA